MCTAAVVYMHSLDKRHCTCNFPPPSICLHLSILYICSYGDLKNGEFGLPPVALCSLPDFRTSGIPYSVALHCSTKRNGRLSLGLLLSWAINFFSFMSSCPTCERPLSSSNNASMKLIDWPWNPSTIHRAREPLSFHSCYFFQPFGQFP
jgi:hypothetical protein